MRSTFNPTYSHSLMLKNKRKFIKKENFAVNCTGEEKKRKELKKKVFPRCLCSWRLQFNFLSRIYFIGTMIKVASWTSLEWNFVWFIWSIVPFTEPTRKGRKSLGKSWWTFLFFLFYFSFFHSLRAHRGGVDFQIRWRFVVYEGGMNCKVKMVESKVF